MMDDISHTDLQPDKFCLDSSKFKLEIKAEGLVFLSGDHISHSRYRASFSLC